MRRSRFGYAYNPSTVAWAEEQSSRIEVFTPTRGLHRGDALQDLAPGFTPDASNYVPTAGSITPRSGLSSFRTASGLSDAALGAFSGYDVTGVNYLLAPSSRSVAFFAPATDAWSLLSYQQPSSWSTSYMPSGSSRARWNAAVAYEPSADQNLIAFTNGVDIPKMAMLAASTETYSDLTTFVSMASTARAVCAFDNRLVWFNVADSSTTYPQRVMWSPRGAPQNYSLAAGANFEDLMDMRGEGVRVVPDGDGILLFSDEEIWRGRKRNDAYAFDFYPIERHFGAPYPATIAATPIGVLFLGRELEVYLVRNDVVRAIGPAKGEGASRVQALLQETLYDAERAWAVYNPTDGRYELNYVGPESVNGYATRGLWYNLVEDSFWPQTFAHELSAGVAYEDPGDAGPIWDGSESAWDAVARAWDDLDTPGAKFNVHAFSSAGTSYWFRSSTTNDDGTGFVAHWASHALNRADQMAHDALVELWIEYKSASASALTVDFMGDPDGAARSSTRVSLAPASAGKALAPAYINAVSPQFKVTVGDGTQPKLARFQAHLSSSGRFGA